MAPEPPLLSMSGITKSFPGVRALDGVDLHLAPGETLGVVGESGSGKSTLARTLLHIHPATAGTIRFRGQDVTTPTRAALKELRRNVQMVFQDPYGSLNPRRRVGSQIADGIRTAAGRGDSAAELTTPEDLLTRVGLPASAADRYPQEFSGGQRQRIAIARALAYRPKLMLMDEPFASVDAQTREGLEDLVLSIRDRYDMTILFVTHDIDESVYLANRVLVLSRPPATLVEDIRVELAEPRDQITTREDPAFIHLRGHVARLIHSGGEPV